MTKAAFRSRKSTALDASFAGAKGDYQPTVVPRFPNQPKIRGGPLI